MIKANEFITTGFSADDATKLNNVIEPLIQQGENITVDFEGITIFTTLFFNNVFAKYIVKMGPEEYQKIFRLVNLSELGENTYQHSVDNAIKYYNLSEDEKKGQDNIVENPD